MNKKETEAIFLSKEGELKKIRSEMNLYSLYSKLPWVYGNPDRKKRNREEESNKNKRLCIRLEENGKNEIENTGFNMYKCIETFYQFTKKNEISGEGLKLLLDKLGFEENPIYDVRNI